MSNQVAIVACVVAICMVASEWAVRHDISMPTLFLAAGLLLGPHVLDWVDFSINAELAASTVTPGNTAPVVSLTTPAMAPLDAVWAHAAPASSMKPNAIPKRTILLV